MHPALDIDSQSYVCTRQAGREDCTPAGIRACRSRSHPGAGARVQVSLFMGVSCTVHNVHTRLLGIVRAKFTGRAASCERCRTWKTTPRCYVCRDRCASANFRRYRLWSFIPSRFPRGSLTEPRTIPHHRQRYVRQKWVLSSTRH